MKPVVWFRFTFASALLAGCGPGELGQASASSDGSATDSVGTTGPGQTGFIAHYFSPWPQAFMHFDDGSGWTPVPGIAMAPEDGAWRVHRHESGSGSVEFVFNDGGDAWDNNDEMNYATSLREFWVKDGVIHDERPEDGDTDESPFCQSIDCGNGVCNEAEQRCDCDEGYLFDAAELTCIEDLCHGVECGFGELCDPDDGSCLEACVPDRAVGSVWTVCQQTTPSSLAVVARYDGPGQLDLPASVVRLNDEVLDGDRVALDGESRTIAVTAASLEPSKYSVLLRMRTGGGDDLLPLFVPMWIGDGIRYSDFIWKDAILYQIMTDRFLDGDPANNIDNSQGTLAEVDDPRSQWQGGDFRGIIDKIRDGYFTDMGINALWISSPLLNSHNSQPAVGLSDPRRFSSYHSYHPIVTGYTHLDDFGYDNPIETAFGTEEELHELVREAHARGIRVIPDFVTNHVQIEAQIYEDHPEWFFPYHPCDGNWDSHRIECWFTTDMPDFDFSNAAAVQTVVDHAIWLIEEYNFDGFRADALKHMDDAFVRALKTAVVEQIETTVQDHSMSDEATVFYMVGESLGGWARYHVREDMVQGQVDERYYEETTASLLTFTRSIRDLADFAIPNDTAYLTSQPIFGGSGGYPGAIMGNFFGNHDQWRALTVAGGDYARLRLAQTFLFTSPSNIPMLYQGDDIGTFGEQDPDNRAMHRFDGLSAEELASLENSRALGRLREAHPALRRGARQTVVIEDYFWVYRVFGEGDEVYVAINRDADRSWSPPAGFGDALGNCSGGTVPSMTSCVFVEG
jgi:glycosidase